jgi:hypothetical protein
MAPMKETNATGLSPTLWGIFHLDREYARELGDPLRTVIVAPSKEEAERQAIDLGFDRPWAHPVTESEAQKAQWLPLRRAEITSTERTAQPARKIHEQSV